MKILLYFIFLKQNTPTDLEIGKYNLPDSALKEYHAKYNNKAGRERENYNGKSSFVTDRLPKITEMEFAIMRESNLFLFPDQVLI